MFQSKFLSAAVAAALAFGMTGAALAASGGGERYAGQEYAKEATVNLAQARAIALKAVKGTITDQELEKEGGGSGLRYSFDVRQGGKTHEVGVDAKTGKLLESSVEGPDAD